MFTNHQWGLLAFNWRQYRFCISWVILVILYYRITRITISICILDMNLKINNLRMQPHLKVGSPILDVHGPHSVSTHHNYLWLWCKVVTCWRKNISKFKPEYLLIDKSTWKYLDKYQVLCLQVQVSTKYCWIPKCQVQLSTKYSRFCIKYKYFTWPQPWTKVMSMQEVKVKVTEVKTQYSRFRTVTPVWIDIWLRNEAQNLK